LREGGGEGYGILFRSEFFFWTTQELEYLFFLLRKARNFFHNLTLGYMTKTLNQIIFFLPPKSEYFFQQHWESEYLFRKKPLPTSPPPPFKLNGRSLRGRYDNVTLIPLVLQLGLRITGTRIPDPPFSSFDPSHDYGMDLCLEAEVYL
jgi:hypothetical protein